MGYGRQGRGGSTSRHESNDSSKEKKEKKLETDVSAEEIRKMVAKFLKELSNNTNPRKAPRLLIKISEEKIRALSFMSKLKYVTDPELIDKYIEAEARRKGVVRVAGMGVHAQRRIVTTRRIVSPLSGVTT